MFNIIFNYNIFLSNISAFCFLKVKYILKNCKANYIYNTFFVVFYYCDI